MSLVNRDVEFTHGEHRLTGTVHLRPGRPPRQSIVIVHGSGAVDRTGADGTLLPIIEHLARLGFSVLSYDKPGVGQSTGDWRTQTFDDRADETLAAVRYLRRDPRFGGDVVGLWGISQGGWIAPMAAVAPGSGIAFVLMVSASPITPYAQVAWLLEQDMRANGFSHTQVTEALDALKDRTAAMAGPAPASEILAAERARFGDRPWYDRFRTPSEELDFMRAIWDFDPVPVLERLRCPVMAAWGSCDLHMPVGECARIIATALAHADNDDFRLEVYPEAGHRLRARTDTQQSGQPLPAYLRSVADWTARFIEQPRTKE